MAESTDRAKPCGAYDTGASDIPTAWHGPCGRTESCGHPAVSFDGNAPEGWHTSRTFVASRP